MEVGGWVQVSLGMFFFVENHPKGQNSSKPVLISWSSMPSVPACNEVHLLRYFT